MSINILFVCHEASRTGAPKILQQVAQGCANRGYRIYIAIAEAYSDAIIPELEEIGTVIKAWKATEEDYPKGIDIIYSNTITNGKYVSDLPYSGVPVITHVHELTSTIKFFGKANFDHVVAHTSSYIACSNAVSNHLKNNFDIEHEKVITIPSFIDPIEIEERSSAPLELTMLDDAILNDRSIIVVGAGWSTFRKGTDLFLKAAVNTPRKIGEREVHFIWVGGNQEEFQNAVPHHMSGRIHFTGQLENPLPLLKRADLFLLTSREDPYPLVALESLFLGKPVVGFSGSGGFDDWANEGIAIPVPNLDSETMASEILATVCSPEIEKSNAKLRKQFVQENASLKVCVERILTHIEDILNIKTHEPLSRSSKNTIWANSDALSDLGVTAIYYGSNESTCKREHYSRSTQAASTIVVPFTKKLRFDPDMIPGLYQFQSLTIESKDKETLIFNISDQTQRQKLSAGGTSVLVPTRELKLLSYGNDPQIIVDLSEIADIDEIRISYSYAVESTSPEYCAQLFELTSKAIER